MSLKRQLEKWQNLDSKGEMQANGERIRRMELEAKVKELEGRLNDQKEVEKTLEKERRTLKATASKWQVRGQEFINSCSTICYITSGGYQTSRNRARGVAEEIRWRDAGA